MKSLIPYRYLYIYIHTVIYTFVCTGSLPTPHVPLHQLETKPFTSFSSPPAKTRRPWNAISLWCCQTAHSTTRILRHSASLLNTLLLREPWNISSEVTSTSEVFDLVQISCAEGHWEQSSSLLLHTTHFIKGFGNIFFWKTFVIGLCLRSSQPKICTFKGTFCFQRSLHMWMISGLSLLCPV